MFAADVQKEGMKKLLADNPALKRMINQGVPFFANIVKKVVVLQPFLVFILRVIH